MCSAYYKVLEKIQGKPVNGHALANLKNIKSLQVAEKEIKNSLKGIDNEQAGTRV